MKTRLIKIPIILLLLCACKNNSDSSLQQIPKVQVKIAGISKDCLPDFIELSGKTIFLNKNNIVAPVSGYVTSVDIKQGDYVSKGEILFKIQTPEAYLLQKSGNSKKTLGTAEVRAPASGTVTGLTVMQKGVFTDRGSVLCLLTASGNLKVSVDVPFEYSDYTKIGKTCTVLLPDSTIIPAKFSKILPRMNEQNQTEKVLANIKSKKFIPENMIVKVLIEKGTKEKSQILPKNCVMTDALMKKFWVMKLINDSTAVQIPVIQGKQNHTSVEIISPEFNTDDRFISEGAYGLSDTVFIEVIK